MSDYEIIPVGQYMARAIMPENIDEAFGRAKSGSEFVQLWFRIEQIDQDTGNEGPYHGSTYKWAGWFTAASTERTIQSLALCGARMQNNDVCDLEGVDSNLVRVTIEHDEHGYARIAWVNDPNRVPLAGIQAEFQLGPAGRKQFAAQVKGNVVAVLQKMRGSAPSAATQNARPATAAQPQATRGALPAQRPAQTPPRSGNAQGHGARRPVPAYPRDPMVRPEDDGRDIAGHHVEQADGEDLPF